MMRVADSETRARANFRADEAQNDRNGAKTAVQQRLKQRIGNDKNDALPAALLLCCLVAEEIKQKGYLRESREGIYRAAYGNLGNTLPGIKEKRTMKRITIIMCAAALLLIAGCAPAIAEEAPTARYDPAFLAVRDVDEPQGAVRVVQEMEARHAAEAEAEAAAAAADENVDESTWEPEYDEAYYEPTYYEPSYSGDGFKQQGVRYHDGRTETWYSSNQAYHYRTGEWEVDDEGYYRDADGYYVVAASDVPEGTVIDGTKGECKVYDSGCDDGVTDYYVAWN